MQGKEDPADVEGNKDLEDVEDSKSPEDPKDWEAGCIFLLKVLSFLSNGCLFSN